MNVISNAIEKVKEVGYKRCEKCPAFWHSVDHWGEADAGCMLYRDIHEFCNLSLLPKFAVKALVKREEKRLDRFYDQKNDELAELENELSEGHRPTA